MKAITTSAAIATLLCVAGCSTIDANWAPFPNKNELVSFSDRWSDASKSESNKVAVLQRTLVKYRDEIYTAAETRSRLEWESTRLSTYGGLAAVIGALADKTGLLNTGAAVATLGITNSSRYRFHEQTQIYVSALKRVACITGKVNSVSDTALALAKNASDDGAREAANNFIDTVVASVDYVRTEYTNGLLGLAPSVPTRDELLGFANTFLAAAPAGPKAFGGVDQAASDAAGTVVKALTSEVRMCSKL